jgi:hypothetical protein
MVKIKGFPHCSIESGPGQQFQASLSRVYSLISIVGKHHRLLGCKEKH